MAAESPSQGAPQVADASGKLLSGIYSILIPPQARTWGEARRMVSDYKVRMNEVASTVCQDVAIAIELLRTSNSMFYSAGRPPVSTIKGTIERLGGDAAIQTLDKMKDIPEIEDPRLAHWVDVARTRCRRTSKVASFFAEALANSLVEDCEVAGLLFHTGEVIAPLHFREQYAKMADEQQTRAKILYRLEKDLKFETMTMGITYLRRIGIPESVLSAIDENAQSKTPARAIMRPICASGSELVLAYESGKLEKFAPGSTIIPPKSSIRMLKMTDAQYQTIFDKTVAYCLAETAAAEAAANAAAAAGAPGATSGTSAVGVSAKA